MIERLDPDSARLSNEIQRLGELLHACVHAGASVSFIQPFSLDDAVAFWRAKVLPAVQSGVCIVLLARDAGRTVGTVQLDLATPPNQPHRAEVRKLLVHPSARRRGIARTLMLEAEKHALQSRRTLLTLDTVTGGLAEHLYESLGYIKSGVIPGYARKPDSEVWEATTIMYKQLARA